MLHKPKLSIHLHMRNLPSMYIIRHWSKYSCGATITEVTSVPYAEFLHNGMKLLGMTPFLGLLYHYVSVSTPDT